MRTHPARREQVVVNRMSAEIILFYFVCLVAYLSSYYEKAIKALYELA